MTHTYDGQNQLLTASDGTTTYTYTYDTVGNILTGNGHTYTYGDADWKDLLTAVDGEAITYDSIGNPTSYYNGTRWTLTWEDGKELSTASDGTNSISYTYDADGLRTSKTVNATKHTYYYAGGKLLRETFGTDTLDFFCDSNGYPYALKHNGTLYYYITNLQGDVMFIVDGNGAVVATYSYDPYGNVLTATGTLAKINPLRYRGYYYDIDTGMYYLQSRYYDPELGRFINADDYVSTGQGILGNNMFAYCLNNPVNGCDPCGTCIHRWDFWNDCGECGGKTLGKKVDEAITTIREFHQKQNAMQNKITKYQNELVKAGVSAAWDVYNSSVERENEMRHQQAVFFNDFVADRFSTPEKATNTLNAIKWPLAIAAAYCGKAGFVEATFLLGVSAGVLEGITWVIAICNEGDKS